MANIKRIGATSEDNFVQAGDWLANNAVLKTATAHGFEFTVDKRILDWGCGVGRVTFPLSKLVKSEIYACDVDPTAIAFLKNENVDFRALRSDYDPPLPFKDAFFDLVYAFSVFTHLPEDAEAAWLEELRRITRPGGLLLLSVVGEKSLRIHHERGTDKHVTWDEVKEKGVVFRSNPLHKHDPNNWPGVTGDYGLTVHHPDYIHKTWGKYFTIVDIALGGAGGQDIVVCKR